MDLRLRLIGTLSLLLGGLITVAMLVQLHSLRDDIAAEISASARLVETLAALGNNGDAQEQATTTDLRHLTLRLPTQSAPENARSPLATVFGLSGDPHIEPPARSSSSPTRWIRRCSASSFASSAGAY